jgi:hypothetical protein
MEEANVTVSRQTLGYECSWFGSTCTAAAASIGPHAIPVGPVYDVPLSGTERSYVSAAPNRT